MSKSMFKDPKAYAQQLLTIACGRKDVAQNFVICAAREFPLCPATFLVDVMKELLKDEGK